MCGSGGAGLHRGGDGGERRVRFLERMTAVMLGQSPTGRAIRRRRRRARGTGRNWVERVDGAREEYGATFQVDMDPGDVFVVQTPGGGGYGSTPS